MDRTMASLLRLQTYAKTVQESKINFHYRPFSFHNVQICTVKTRTVGWEASGVAGG